MKGGVCREAKKGVADRYMGEGSGGVRNSDVVSRSSPIPLVAASVVCVPPSSSTGLSFYSNEAFNQARGFIPCPQGRFSFQEASDVQQTSESVAAKADSEGSSLASTPSKKPKSDLKPRLDQVIKLQPKAGKSSTTNLRRSTSLNIEAERQINLDHEMHFMRQTILDQEAVFREQVQELHRVHKVQTLLMVEMKKKDLDILSRSSGTNCNAPSQSPALASINSGGKRTSWSPATGQHVDGVEYNFQASVHLPEPSKSGAEKPRNEINVIVPGPETKLPGSLERSRSGTACIPPVRRTFDLERPPEDDDEDLEARPDQLVKLEQDTCMGSPASCVGPENEVSLNLGTGWDQGKVERSGRQLLMSPTDGEGHENSRSSKRSRGAEEATLFPFLAAKSEIPLRESPSPLRPTPTVATQSFLGGLWQLQLGRKEDGSPPASDVVVEEPEVVKKKERLSLNLEVDERSLQAISQAPHWLLQGPVKPVKKAACHSENPNPSSQQTYPPQGSSEKGFIKLRSSHTEEDGNMAPNIGSPWDGERRGSGTAPQSTPQVSHSQRLSDDGVQPGIGVYRTPVLTVGSTLGGATSNVAGYGPYNLAQGVADSAREGLTLYSSWRDADGPNNGFAHGVFTQRHPLGAGGLPALGVQLRSFEGHPHVAPQGLLVGPPVNMGAGNAFVPDSTSGIWYQQRSSYSQFQQYQQQQQLASLQPQAGGLTSSGQGPWHTPMHISQGTPYPQGTVYAIPAAATATPSVGLPMDGLRRICEDIPGANWASGNIGPPFTPFSIVVPPKPPFKRPPKLVLTHDGTTMELKLVSPDKGGVRVVQEKSFSGSSDEDLGDALRMPERKEKVSNDATHQFRLQKDREEMNTGFRAGPGRHRGGKREREERTTSSPVKDKANPASSAAEWMERVGPGTGSRVLAGRNAGVSAGAAVAVSHTEVLESIDDADGSDGGSGGSGVGDVINPGERATQSLGTFVAVSNLPAGEGEEGLHMGELGIQADLESQAMMVERPFKPALAPSINRPVEEKLRKHKESSLEQLSASFGSNASAVGRNISRENSDASEHGLDHPQKRLRGLQSSHHEVEEKISDNAGAQQVQEQSVTSSGGMSQLPISGSHPQILVTECQGLDESRNTQLDLQRPASTTIEPRLHSLKFQESNSSQGKLEESKHHVTENVSQSSVMNADSAGRDKSDERHKKTRASNFGEAYAQERETKPGHSKQLSEASSSSPIGAQRGGVHHNPHSPELHQVPSLTSEGVEGLKKVSQASETVQGNGRSPLRICEWIEPIPMEQDHFCSPGGIKEEVDGTLVERLRGYGMEQKCKEVCPEEKYSANFNQEDLGQFDAAIDKIDPSSSGMCISQTTTKPSQGVAGESKPARGMSKGERQNASSRILIALAPDVEDGEAHVTGLTHSKQPAALYTGKSEDSLDGDKDSVSSSKPIQEQDGVVSAGDACLTGEVLNGSGVVKTEELLKTEDASSKGSIEVSPAVPYSSVPSPQSTVSGPPVMNRPCLPPAAIKDDQDEFSGNPCENSNLAATLLLSLAPKRPSSSGSKSKAEKNRCLSILRRSTDSRKDVGDPKKRESHTIPSRVCRPNSCSITSQVDVGSPASVKCQVVTPGSGGVIQSEGQISGPRGETERISSELHPTQKLDFFESVTLMLKESKLLKDATSEAAIDMGEMQSGKIMQSTGGKPQRKKTSKRSSAVHAVIPKEASRLRGSGENQTPETSSGSKDEIGIQAGLSSVAAGQPLEVGGPADDGKATALLQSSSDQDGESPIGADGSLDATPQRSFWGDASRRKRMQRSRNVGGSQGQQNVLTLRKFG